MKNRLEQIKRETKELAGRLGIEIEERNFNPISVFKDTLEAAKTCFKNKKYFQGVVHSIVCATQFVGSYNKVEFDENTDGRQLKKIIMNKPGFVLEPISILVVQFPVMNTINLLSYMFAKDKIEEHEWRHAYSDLRIEEKRRNGEFKDGMEAYLSNAVQNELRLYTVEKKEYKN